MARRRATNALGGLGEGIAGVGKLMLSQQNADAQSQRVFTRQILNDYEDKVTKGELEPEQATAALRSYGINIDPSHFHMVAPTIERKLQAMVAGFGDAKNPGEIPSTEELVARAPAGAKRVALGQSFSPAVPDPETSLETLPSTQMQPTNLPAFQQVLTAAEKARNRFSPTRVETVNADGIPEERFVSSNPATLTGQAFAKKSTPEQETGLQRRALTARAGQGIAELEGAEAGRKDTAQAISGKFSEPFVGAEIGAANRMEVGTRAEKVATEVAGARAKMPLEKEMAQFRQSLENGSTVVQTINDPKTGEEKLVLVNKSSGTMTPIVVPEGMQGGKAKTIPATIADNIAGLNTAEIEGVKVLRALRASGLDTNNDPFDPRWQKFLINTLKIAPADAQKADIQQRTAFINAAMTRALMGSRPSQYVAKEIIQPHLPAQNMSGAQLARVMKNVLEQSGERRNEFSRIIGVPVERFAVGEGIGYAAYKRELEGTLADPATATLTIDPVTGKLVPKK